MDFAMCFTCAPTSPISNMFANLFFPATTTPIDIDVNVNFSIIPFLFATSIYPCSRSSSVKNFSTSLLNVAIIDWHMSSASIDGIIAMKSSPPIWPINEFSKNFSWIHLIIVCAVN